MDELNVEFKKLLDKYTPKYDSWPTDKLKEIACLAAGLTAGLEGAKSLGIGPDEVLKVVLSLVSVAFEMGKRSAHGIELHLESEPFGSYKEAKPDGTHYGIELLTPSQVDVRNHINKTAGLERRWVPA